VRRQYQVEEKTWKLTKAEWTALVSFDLIPISYPSWTRSPWIARR
jgi:hypothetical protein